MGNLNIRTNALRLMELLYHNCDSSFRVQNLKCFDLLPDINQEDLRIASKYLIDKVYISRGACVSNDFSCSITADGIDWLEDCGGVKPTLPTK